MLTFFLSDDHSDDGPAFVMLAFSCCLLMLADAFAVLLPFVDAESDVADVSAVCLLVVYADAVVMLLFLLLLCEL